MENYDVSTLLETEAFTKVDQARYRHPYRQVALKILIVDGVQDSKCRKRKEQEGERCDWLDEVILMNDGSSTSQPVSLRRHLGQINGAGLKYTTALRGGVGYVIETYRAKDLDQHRLWRITMSAHSWGQGHSPKLTKQGTGKPTAEWQSRL